jgi:hypothetical protein
VIGVPINWSKSDNQGNFVAKFIIGDIVALFEGLEEGYYPLILSGTTVDGGSFTGTDEVMVINIKPKKK